MQDVTTRVSDSEMDNARMSRERSTNPPDFEPGMSDDDDFLDSLDDMGSGGNMMGDFGMGGMNNGMNMGGMGMNGMGMNGMGMGMNSMNPQQPEQSTEDKFFDSVKKFFTGFKDWATNFIKSFKEFDIRKKVGTGKTIFITGLVCACIGFICLFFTKDFGRQVLPASLFASAFGVVLFMFSYDKAKEQGVDLSDNQPTPQPDIPPDMGGFGGDIDFGDDDSIDDSDDSSFDDDIDFDDDDPIDLDDVEEFVPVVDTQPTEEPTVKDSETVLNSVQIDSGMVTRQYLYETISQILPSCDQTYDKEVIYDPDSREFNAWDALIKQAADIFRTTQEDSPDLIELKDKLFYYQLTVSRVKWIKNIDQLVDELVNIVKYDDNGGKDDMVQGSGVYIGNKALIKIYKGSNAMVSVKDAYRQVKDFILDTSNKMPVVIGIDSEGKVVARDLVKLFALCVAGMPRSGKTWTVQSMLTQMMMYMKPSELQFYIYDPKDNISDFKAMTMPHIKDFRSKDEDIVEGLKYIVKVEAERRNRIIGDAGFVNIEDYKKANPIVEMPYLYVIIDEVITFATRMKDEKPELYKAFQSYLKELVSRLPSMGIRLFMIPHVLKNDIIQKTTTDLIPCRISVKGAPDHIEAVTGAKPKDFTHVLTHYGDMAVRLDGYTNFCHSAVLAPTNEESNRIFNFLTQFWLKIEPESIKGSVYARRLKEQGNVDELRKYENYLSESEVNSLLRGIDNDGSIRDERVTVTRPPTIVRDMEDMSDRSLGNSRGMSSSSGEPSTGSDSSADIDDDESWDDMMSGLDDW